MKTVLLVALLGLLAFSGFAQDNDKPVFNQVTDPPVKPLTKMDYLRKSKNQRTVALVLLGSGLTLDIIGIITAYADKTKALDNIATFVLPGTVSMIISIPFFVAAHRNKNRAVNISINTEQFQLLKKNKFYSVNYPALNLKLSL